jgi:hypothetical protein
MHRPAKVGFTRKVGFKKSGESPCYSEHIHALGLASAAAKRNYPADAFLKRWTMNIRSSKSVV